MIKKYFKFDKELIEVDEKEFQEIKSFLSDINILLRRIEKNTKPRLGGEKDDS